MPEGPTDHCIYNFSNKERAEYEEEKLGVNLKQDHIDAALLFISDGGIEFVDIHCRKLHQFANFLFAIHCKQRKSKLGEAFCVNKLKPAITSNQESCIDVVLF